MTDNIKITTSEPLANDQTKTARLCCGFDINCFYSLITLISLISLDITAGRLYHSRREALLLGMVSLTSKHARSQNPD